jgi:hypothetical protein
VVNPNSCRSARSVSLDLRWFQDEACRCTMTTSACWRLCQVLIFEAKKVRWAPTRFVINASRLSLWVTCRSHKIAYGSHGMQRVSSLHSVLTGSTGMAVLSTQYSVLSTQYCHATRYEFETLPQVPVSLSLCQQSRRWRTVTVTQARH